jgi:hypothetical protein
VAKGSLVSDLERKVLALRAIGDPRIRTIASGRSGQTFVKFEYDMTGGAIVDERSGFHHPVHQPGPG